MNVKKMSYEFSRVYVTNIYIQIQTRAVHWNSGKKSREKQLVDNKQKSCKLDNQNGKNYFQNYQYINISIRTIIITNNYKIL